MSSDSIPLPAPAATRIGDRVRRSRVADSPLLRRPELLGLLREVSRLGAPAAARLVDDFAPLVSRATAFLTTEMEAGRFRSSDARLLLVSVYSTIVGVATEVEVLRAVGIEPTLRSMVVRRREMLRFLHSALVVDPPASMS